MAAERWMDGRMVKATPRRQARRGRVGEWASGRNRPPRPGIGKGLGVTHPQKNVWGGFPRKPAAPSPGRTATRPSAAIAAGCSYGRLYNITSNWLLGGVVSPHRCRAVARCFPGPWPSHARGIPARPGGLNRYPPAALYTVYIEYSDGSLPCPGHPKQQLAKDHRGDSRIPSQTAICGIMGGR